MSELLFLLLPIAALSGYFLGCKEANKKPKKPQSFNHYFSGINFLLNNENQKAADVLSKVVELNEDTLETHLAIGSLFRRRGQVEAAIKIHQNLLAKPNLDKNQRALVLLELARNYLASGVLDRAEKIFLELVDREQQRKASLIHLIDIYQQEKDWQKAIDTARLLEFESTDNKNEMIAHYYCELALLALAKGDIKRGIKNLKHGISYNRDSIRAHILLGQSYYQLKNYKSAIKIYRRVLDKNQHYLDLIIEPLSSCYQELGMYYERKQINDDWLAMKKLMKKIIAQTHDYRCKNCGFSAATIYWLCPSCKSWDSVLPITLLENRI